MDPEFRAYLDETCRHFEVVAEEIKGELRLVMQGISSLAGRLDRFEQNLREEILEMKRDLGAVIKASHAELDRTIQRLET